MCGIVGYLGKREAYPILIKGLRRLEYRGYDSAGVAMINAEGSLNVYKTSFCHIVIVPSVHLRHFIIVIFNVVFGLELERTISV